ncbi:heme NO-binding domain-containing protein [Sulfitobacter sabulilitoris]|uniref:Heme NO-binding protein n=1 Tax=Sulfitobacter sabulilitoris TaxID=2562655 RepID=A0A5S3PL67_9RHOB|nr:heme NO-binding domain-containing protein [Sulfitobacter sabulilitoris]TMM55133.1 heme NO-binding protein [Sulfitobacter sabulilitoris]
MHGLVNRAVEGFVCDSYGEEKWLEVVRRARLEDSHFEAMLSYDDAITIKTVTAVAEVLSRPAKEVLEDIGAYLVSHPKTEALRRLMRFSGDSYEEFLQSLDDLPDRARLAVSDLHLPRTEVHEQSANQFTVTCFDTVPGYGSVMMGVLRAMADDYGALVFLEFIGHDAGVEKLAVSLLEAEFAEGREFSLGVRAG